MRKILLPILAVCSLIAAPDTLAFESRVEAEINTPWEGFGYNQWGFARESDGNTFKPWSDDLWSVTSERILAISPSLVRLPLIRDWFNKDDNGNKLPIGTYNWDSKYMQAFYKIMDLYKEHDIKVMSGFWGVGYNYEDYKDFYTTDDCARLQADLIEHLFTVKGYDKIITSYAPTNEPLGVGFTYAQWSTMIKKLHAELQRRGLPADILSGCDSWGDWIWLPAREDAQLLSAYDYHNYLNDTPDDTYNWMYNRTIETTFANNLANIQKYDKANKPIHVSEMAPIGVPYIDWPVDDAPAHCRIDTYEYALGFWDYGIQLARSGMSSGLAWALDGLEQNKNAGMWNNAGTYGGMTLRPWYYTWSLMCRYFPGGAKILKMSELEGRKDVRILGARVGTDDYSWVAVNRRIDAASDTQQITFKANTTKTEAYIYRFNRNNCGDGVSLALPYEKVTLDKDGITIELPMEEGVLITTMKPLEKDESPTATALTLDFETQDGYMLLGDFAKGIKSYVGSNPRRRDPNLSDNSGYSEIQINDINSAKDCFSTIVPLKKVLVGDDSAYLNIQLYRSRKAKVAVAVKFVDDEKFFGCELDMPNRSWQQFQLDLTAYKGKVLDYIVIYPYRDASTSEYETESLVYDNISFTNTAASPVSVSALPKNEEQQYSRTLNVDFEYLNSAIKLTASSAAISESVLSNPSIQDVNGSSKACKLSLLTSNVDEAQNAKLTLNLYPYVVVPEKNSNLFMSYYHQQSAASTIKVVAHFLTGETAEGEFVCDTRRLWMKSGINLSAYVGKVITSIDIYPNMAYAESLGNIDTTYIDDIIFSSEEVSVVENIANEDISIVSIDGNIQISGINGQPVVVYSLDGLTVYSSDNVDGQCEINVRRGIYIVKVGNRSYKIVNK